MAVNGHNNVNWFDIFIVFVNEGITCCYEWYVLGEFLRNILHKYEENKQKHTWTK